MINETINQTATELIKSQVHTGITIPSVIIVWASFIIGYPLVAWAFSNKHTDWSRFWGVWFFVTLISGIFVTFVIAKPDAVQDFAEFIMSLLRS